MIDADPFFPGRRIAATKAPHTLTATRKMALGRLPLRVRVWLGHLTQSAHVCEEAGGACWARPDPERACEEADGACWPTNLEDLARGLLIARSAARSATPRVARPEENFTL